MTLQEFQDLLKVIQTTQAESRTIEVKQAASGSPKRIYDTISSFSNQDDGGVIVFGLDENAGFAEVGVKDVRCSRFLAAEFPKFVPGGPLASNLALSGRRPLQKMAWFGRQAVLVGRAPLPLGSCREACGRAL